MNFSIYIFCREANHQTARIRPRLGTEIFQVLDSQTGFFHYFTMNRLFQILASLNETSHETVEISLEIASVYQQDLIIFLNQNDDGCGKRRPDLFAAFCTFLTDVGCHFHRSSANAAELGIHVPIVELLTLSCFLVKGRREFVETRAQTAHFVLRIAGNGLRNGEGLHLCSVFHWGNVENVSPRLCWDWTLF